MKQMSNPLNDFLEEFGQQKEASYPFGASPFDNFKRNMGNAMVSGFGAAGATALIGGAGLAVSKIMDAATAGRDFRKMLDVNPDLRDAHSADPRMFNQMYSSLRSMNPSFAKDPLVAGTYMRRMAENPMHAGGILVDAVNSRDKFPSIASRATDEGIGAGKSHFSKQQKK